MFHEPLLHDERPLAFVLECSLFHSLDSSKKRSHLFLIP